MFSINSLNLKFVLAAGGCRHPAGKLEVALLT
jgi:hypothetical protein